MNRIAHVFFLAFLLIVIGTFPYWLGALLYWSDSIINPIVSILGGR